MDGISCTFNLPCDFLFKLFKQSFPLFTLFTLLASRKQSRRLRNGCCNSALSLMQVFIPIDGTHHAFELPQLALQRADELPQLALQRADERAAATGARA